MYRQLFTLLCFFVAGCVAAQPVVQHFSEQPLFVNGTEGYACYRIPAIIATPQGELLAFAEARVSSCQDHGNLDIVMKRSRDNGLSWDTLEIVIDRDSLQAGNPAPVVDRLDPRYPDGRVLLLYNTGSQASEWDVRNGKGVREVWYTSSTDGGRNWATSVNITTQVHRPLQPTYHPAYNFKEDWRSYANAPGHAIQLQQAPYRGRLFVPANHSAGPPRDSFNEYRAHGYYSDDHGDSWQLGGSVDVPSSNESIAVELSDGRVMQNIRQQNGEKRQRLVAISSQGGELWDTTYFDPQLPEPVCQASLLSVTLAGRENVLLFSNPAHSQHRQQMTVKVSYDQGQTWPVQRLIRQGASAYSDLVQAADGYIGLLYEHGNDGGIHFARFNAAWLGVR